MKWYKGSQSRQQTTVLYYQQRGIVLLVFLLLLLIIAGIIFTQWFSARQLVLAQQQQTYQALRTAKRALLAYAASDAERPGELPCPDTDNDGKTNGIGGNCSSLRGWLPWFRLRIDDVRDGQQERLWYGLSPAFRPYGRVPPGKPLSYHNIEQLQGLQVTGASESQIAAVLIAPGKLLPVNKGLRSTAANQEADNLASAYLEAANQNTDLLTYSAQSEQSNFNDVLITITVKEIMHAVADRVIHEVKQAIQQYYALNGHLAYASASPAIDCDGNATNYSGYLPLQDATNSLNCGYVLPEWFYENNWHYSLRYEISPNCASGSQQCDGKELQYSLKFN